MQYDSISPQQLLNNQQLQDQLNDQLNFTEHNDFIQKRVRMRIPQNYHQEPIISSLVEKYGLKVNILAAILGANGAGDGWFDLALIGIPEKVDAAIIYLSELDIEIWLEGINNDIW